MPFTPEDWDLPYEEFRKQRTHQVNRAFRQWVFYRRHPRGTFRDYGFEGRDRKSFSSQLERIHRNNRLHDLPMVLTVRRAKNHAGKHYVPGDLILQFVRWLLEGCPCL